MESTINTFSKGLNRDVSPSKYSQENYFDALNIKLITDDALSSFSITNEKGNTNVYNIPTIQAVYKISFSSDAESSRRITINGIPYNYSLAQSWTYDILYGFLIQDFSVQIAAGQYAISNQLDSIVITGLNSALTVSATTSVGTVTVETIVPQLGNAIVLGGVQLRDYLILFTEGFLGSVSDIPSTVNNGQFWKLRILEDGTVENIGASNNLVPSEHLIYNNQLNFSTEHRIEAYSNYETSEVGKVYFTDNYNNFRHFNVLDTDTFSIPLSALDIIPEVSFGIQTLLEVTDTGSYTSGMVQYAHQYYNLHGSQSAFSSTTGLIHLTKSSEILSDTKLYFGTATDKPTGKAVRLSITDLDKKFTNVRVVSLHYKTLHGTPTITIIEDREVPANGTIYITDSGNNAKGEISDIEFSALGSVNFKCKTFDVKDGMLFPANIVESFYDVDEDGYWDSRAYRWDTNGEAVISSETASSITLNSLSDLTGVPEEYDCIQSKEDQLSTYKYTKTNKRYGGEGTNIKYYFNTEYIVEESAANAATTLGATAGASGYPNYANPLIHATKLSNMRDEVYRFFIVFKDVNGRKSFAKWIADIKMPSVAETDVNNNSFKTFAKFGNEVKVNILSLTFEISNLPDSAVAFEIARSKREDFDKTIVCQGILSSVVGPGSGLTFYTPHTNPRTIVSIDAGSRIFNFLSPEVNFFKKPLSSGELHVIGSLTYIQSSTTPAGEGYTTKKVNDLQVPTISINNTTNIIESRIVPPGYTARYVINNRTYSNYRYDAGNISGYMCTNLVVSTDEEVMVSALTATGGYALTNIVRTLTSQYGGASFSARYNNKCIGCYSEEVNGNPLIVKVYGGDTFIGYFDLMYGIYDKEYTASGVHNSQCNLLFPVETSINLALRHDVCVTKSTVSNSFLTQETAGEQVTTNFGGATYSQQTDLYLYNSAYSRQNDVISYFSKPLNFSNNKTFDARILSSELKKTNEEIDSWTSFLATNFVDVDATYGPINKIVTFGKRLLFFQDKAVGWASVNERSLITPEAGGTSLSLGKGGILDQYFYISRHSGSKHQFSVVSSPNGVYYYDAANNRINVFTGEQNEPISELKGFSSYLKQMGITGIRKTDTTIVGIGVHGIYDQKFNRVLFTFNDMGYADEFTIGYNEMLQCFESFYSFKPRLYLKFDDFIYSIDPAYLSKGYLHNSGDYCKFYGNIFDSEIEVIINKDPFRAKAFTNVEYVLNTFPESIQNFESIRVYNNYQDTGNVILTAENSNRRARVFRITLGRNNKDGDTSSRIISEFANMQFKFNNDLSINTKFKLDNIITYYMSKSY